MVWNHLSIPKLQQFGNALVISLHALLCMWLLNHVGFIESKQQQTTTKRETSA